jgi:hypothetical protein
MSAQIFRFPRYARGAIRVECADDWQVIYRRQAWPHVSREAALQEANRLAVQVNAAIIVQAPNVERSPC